MFQLIKDLKSQKRQALLSLFMEGNEYCVAINELLTARLGYGKQINTQGIYQSITGINDFDI